MTDEQQALWEQIQAEKKHFNPDRAKLARLARALAETDCGLCSAGPRFGTRGRSGSRSPSFGKWKDSSGDYRHE